MRSFISIAMKVISRQKAIDENLGFYFTGIPCKNGHVCERYTRSKTCVTCGRETSKRWRANPDNRDHYNLYQQSYSGHNLHFIRKYIKDPNEIWFDKTHRARKALKRAAPNWVNRDEIRMVYEECIRLSESMGMEFEVDHVIPIYNRNVCGLHIAGNLQVVSHSLNTIKANKFNADVASRELLKWLKERGF